MRRESQKKCNILKQNSDSGRPAEDPKCFRGILVVADGLLFRPG